MTSSVTSFESKVVDLPDYTWSFGRAIDRLVTVEMRPQGLPWGKIDRLHEAALAESGYQSQSMMVAAQLRETVRRGDAVFIVTGAGFPPYMPEGENDGPIGAATLGRALFLGLGAVPIYITENFQVRPLRASSEAAGVPVRENGLPVAAARGAFIEPSATTDAEMPEWTTRLYEKYNPAAVFFIERLGPNKAGIIHGSTGLIAPGKRINMTPILAEAHDRGILSIGIGDAGNEIGFGRIFDAVQDIQEFGLRCQCDCGEGMATTTVTDMVVVASVSNWGAYAIDACLAHLLGVPGLAQSPVMARKVIDACFAGGGYEAVFCTQLDLVDGIAGDSSVALVQLMQEMVRISQLPRDSGPLH